MRQATLLFIVAAAGWAQSRDPAGLMPLETPVFVEARDAGALAELLLRTPAVAQPESRGTDGFRNTLRELAAAGMRRVAFGFSPATMGRDRWVAVIESSDPKASLAMIQGRAPEAASSTVIAPWLVVASSEKTLAEALDLAEGKGRSLLERADFKDFRANATGPDAPIRLHADVTQMWPRALRQVKNSANIWSVLLGCHVNHVLKTVGVVSGGVTTKDGFELALHGEIRAPDARAVTEGRPSQGIIAAPEGVAFRLSVPRNLTYFWARRKQLLPDAAEATLAELETRVESATPGWTVEKHVGELGEAFDLYIAPGDSTAEIGRRAPAMALVAVAAGDPDRCRQEAMRAFFGIVNATLDGEGASPVGAVEAHCHRGIELTVATAAQPAVMARVHDRIIVANQEAFAKSLVDAALDRELVPRPAGDELVAYGPAAARVIADARLNMASGWLSTRIGSEAAAQRFLDAVEGFLRASREARIRFDLDGKDVRLGIEAAAPTLLPSDRPK